MEYGREFLAACGADIESTGDMHESLKSARDAYSRRGWEQAFQAFYRLKGSLEASDLELLGMAAYLTARDHRPHLERAYELHLEAGEKERASRCAFWMGLLHLLSGESALAGGWLARGRRLVEGRDCVEAGYHLIPECEQRLAAGESESASKSADAAAAIGNRFEDADLIAIARHLQGRARIQMGEIASGLSLLDEAMLGAVSGRLSPVATGLIYCSVIEVCQQVYEVNRAGASSCTPTAIRMPSTSSASSFRQSTPFGRTLTAPHRIRRHRNSSWRIPNAFARC